MKESTKNTLKYFGSVLWTYRISYSIVLISIILGVIIHFITIPFLFKEIIDIFGSYGEGIVKETLVEEALKVLVFIFVLEILGHIIWRIAEFVNSYFQASAMRDIEVDCFSKLQRHSYSFFANSFTGGLVTKVNRTTRAFETLTDKFQWDLIPLVTMIIFISIILFYFAPGLSYIILIWVFFYLLLTFLFYRWKYKFNLRESEEDSKVTASLADSITNILAIKTFAKEKEEHTTFYQVSEKRKKARRLSWDISSVGNIFQSILLTCMEVGLLYYSILLWRDGIITIGVILLVVYYSGNLFMNLWRFGNVIKDTFSAFADAEEMTEILYLEEEVKDPSHPEDSRIKKGEVEFRTVDFAYENSFLFKDFSVKIPSAQSVGLVGHSGAGKSSMLKLLLRFSDVNSGAITIDGQDISKITQHDLHEVISYIPQEPILFHRSLRENIAYAKQNASEEEIIEAAKKAHIHDLILTLPQGYDTLVGERGVKLSGGERQRVIIARALLKDAPLLILDEATSALDSHSEKLIQESLKELMKGKTTIAIAHRLSTIQQMDRILVMDKGKVVEEGTHKSLLKKKKGVYKELWTHQAGGFLTE
jgi:ATP-binding cassette subfamily B protein